jgi:hypothetical protein
MIIKRFQVLMRARRERRNGFGAAEVSASAARFIGTVARGQQQNGARRDKMPFDIGANWGRIR